MINKRKYILLMAIDLAEKLKENDIWFALDNQSMLGAIRHGGFVPWFEKFEIMVNVSGYNTIKRLFPENVVDSFKDKSYNEPTCSWVANSSDWKKEQPFIKIRVITDTTVKKFISFTRLSKRFERFFKRQNYNDIRLAINDLYEPKLFQGHILLDKKNVSVDKRWIQSLSYKTIDVEFSGHKFPVIKEYKEVLENWFGSNYMEAKVPSVWDEYPAPLKYARSE